MGESMREIPVICEEQQPLGFSIQSTDWIDPRFGWNKFDDGFAIVGVLRRRHDTCGLIQEVVHEVGSHAHRRSINFNDVGSDVHSTTKNRNYTIDSNPSRLDHFLAHTSRAPATGREYFLEALPLRRLAVGHACSVSPLGCGTMRSPCSSASTTRASGTNSAMDGRASIDSSPKRSRNNGVVPYITA